MGFGSGYQDAANQQAAASQQAVNSQTQANRPNQSNAFGSTDWPVWDKRGP